MKESKLTSLLDEIRKEYPAYKNVNLYYLFKFIVKTRIGSPLWVGSIGFDL
jgi:hypothetical protein